MLVTFSTDKVSIVLDVDAQKCIRDYVAELKVDTLLTTHVIEKAEFPEWKPCIWSPQKTAVTDYTIQWCCKEQRYHQGNEELQV